MSVSPSRPAIETPNAVRAAAVDRTTCDSSNARTRERPSARAERPSGAVAHPREDVETVYAVLQSTTRRGPWEPPETMRLVSVPSS